MWQRGRLNCARLLAQRWAQCEPHIKTEAAIATASVVASKLQSVGRYHRITKHPPPKPRYRTSRQSALLILEPASSINGTSLKSEAPQSAQKQRQLLKAKQNARGTHRTAVVVGGPEGGVLIQIAIPNCKTKNPPPRNPSQPTTNATGRSNFLHSSMRAYLETNYFVVSSALPRSSLQSAESMKRKWTLATPMRFGPRYALLHKAAKEH